MQGEQEDRSASCSPDSTPIFVSETRGKGVSALVLLHGFGGSHYVWDGVCAHLDPSLDILAYDLPGHAVSLSTPFEGAAPAFAKTLLADLAARDLTSIHLVGHSLGGAVAILMALREPRRFASLTLLAPGGIGREINVPLLQRFATAASSIEIADALRAMAGPEFTPPVDAVRHCAEERAVPGQIDTLQHLCGLITRDGEQGAFAAAQLAALAMPVQLVWGECDPVLPVTQALNVPTSFGVHREPGLGHMLPLEAPEGMAGHISRAISAHS